MSQPLSEIVEEKSVTCGVCEEAFNVQGMSLDDWNFARDLEVETDCCNACRTDTMYSSLPFKCSNCGMKYKTYMESDNNGSICKWCAGDDGYDWSI